MAKQRVRFSDELRQAVDESGLSRYRICKELGVAESLLSRFMSAKGFLGQETIDALAELLDLHVAAGTPRRKKKG
jgi:transcriptional regulator with XRE-family HTH domain